MHIGHVSFALEALSVCNLDKIILLPEKYPRGKKQVADFDTRVHYIEQLITGYPQLEIVVLHTMPITVHSEKKELSKVLSTNDAVLLLGSDTLPNLRQWHDIELLLQDHELCIGIRGADTQEYVAEYVSHLEKVLGMKITYQSVETSHKYISSTQIRSQKNYVPL